MIQKIIVTNHKNETIELELMNPEKSGLNIRDVDGLGPVKASINTTDIATGDGKIFNNARKSYREISITLGLTYFMTIEECRHLVYKYFPTKQKVKFQVITDTRNVYTYGYVEVDDADIFSQDETCKINIICPNPYFIGNISDNFEMSDVFSTFEFAETQEEKEKVREHGYSMLENNSITEKLIQFGEYRFAPEYEFKYNGETDTGVIFRIHTIGTVKNIMLAKNYTREFLKINTDMLPLGYMKNGDTLEICTINGEKYCNLIRDGIIVNAIGCISRGSNWLKFNQGGNVISYNAEFGEEYMILQIDVEVLYEGV